MMLKFYREFFRLTDEDRRAFDLLAGDEEAVEAAVAAGTEAWRGGIRESCADSLTCRQMFAMRARLAAAKCGVRGRYGKKVVAAFALFLTDMVEQRVRALDFEECGEDAECGELAAGTFVEIEKVSASGQPAVQPGDWGGWVAGSPDNAGSLPVGYALRGILLEPLRVGAPMRVLRVERNGVPALGEFCSTAVVALRPGYFAETSNSVYKVLPAEAAAAECGEEP